MSETVREVTNHVLFEVATEVANRGAHFLRIQLLDID